ncbi:hypothetical protein ES705_10542 [subsurface metagenome]
MPPVAAAVVGIGSLIGGAAVGAAGLAGAAASAVGGLAGGVGSLLFGAGQAGVPVMAGGEMGALAAASAAPATIGTAGILGTLPAAVSGTIGYLGDIIPSAVGLGQIFKPPEKIGVPPTAKALPVPAPAISKSALPVLGAPAPPVILRTGAAAKPAPDYILLIGLAVLALFLLRRK